MCADANDALLTLEERRERGKELQISKTCITRANKNILANFPGPNTNVMECFI